MASKKPRREIRLMVVGGHEKRADDGEILRRFVEMAGGKKARLVVCGAALDDAEPTVQEYREVFERIGVAEVYTEPYAARETGQHSQELLAATERATGIYFTGGDQLQITSLIAGTEFEDRIRRRLPDGLVVGGTSAGAAAMSSTMLIGGPSEGTVRRADVTTAPGLGYWRDVTVDTHFNQRGRVHRLMALFAQNPGVLGIGLDEDTGVEVTPGVRFTVHGTGAVMVFDGRVTHSNAADVGDDEILAVTDSWVHVLPAGYGFNLQTMRPILPDGEEIAVR